LGIERLDARVLLDADGIAWAALDLTISFAPDGTNIAGYENSLFTEFNSLAASDSWRDTIVRGFQTWAQYTTATVTTVDDSGEPFGVPGPTQGDARFGDVRVGAIPMAVDVIAISIPHDEVISGTWAGDVLFNSDAEFSSLDEIFAVAVHEAGHVFGLGHSTDPASPMFLHGITPAVTPTAEDIAAIQSLYGGLSGAEGPEDEHDEEDEREDEADEHEREHEDDELVTANGLALSANFQEAIRYDATGQIFDPGDIDYYQLVPIDDEFEQADVLTVTVRATTPLGLIPRATIFNHEGQEFEADILANANGQLVVQAKGADPRQTYFVKVDSAQSTGSHAIGGYDFVATFGTREVELGKITSGTLEPGKGTRTSALHVSETRLVHFVLATGPIEGDSAAATWAAIYDGAGNPVYRVAAHAGESRSANTVLLTPGDYRIEFHGETSSGSTLGDIDYELLAESISLQVGPQPVDPTEMPILPCSDPAADPVYCSPDEVVVDPVILPDPYPYPFPDPVVIVTPPPPETESWYWDGMTPPNDLPAPLGTGSPPPEAGTNPVIPDTTPPTPNNETGNGTNASSSQVDTGGTSTGSADGQTTQPPSPGTGTNPVVPDTTPPTPNTESGSTVNADSNQLDTGGTSTGSANGQTVQPPPPGTGTNSVVPDTTPPTPDNEPGSTVNANSSQLDTGGISTGGSSGQTTQPPVGSVTAAWQNTSNPYDVNADNLVTPLDVLLVVNYLNFGPSMSLSGAYLPGQPHIDVNADGHASPIDALIVIAGLNAGSIAAAEGEATLAPPSEPSSVPAAAFVPPPSLSVSSDAPVPPASPAVAFSSTTATAPLAPASSTPSGVHPLGTTRSLTRATTRSADERLPGPDSLDEEVLGAIALDVGQAWNGL